MVEEVLIEKDKIGSKKGVTIEKLIDKNSPWGRTMKFFLNEPNPKLQDYVKPPYPFINKKPL